MTEEELKKTLYEASNSYQRLLQKTHDEALMRNKVQTEKWSSYKKEHEELIDRLLSLRDKLSHTIMVPLGNKALMRGKLVHTNEIMVCLGDGWFVKQSAQEAVGICQRRIQHCDEILAKLNKEEELLNSRKTFAFESDAFSCETQELIEPYDEEAEKQWRARHRLKEKEYRQKLAEIKKSQPNKITTEEELWQRLDALDAEEELEDELNRMVEDSDEEEESDDSDSSSDQETNLSQIETEVVEKTNSLKRRVSFKDENNVCDESDKNIEDTIHISFNHTDTPSSVTPTLEGEITSPADIYSQYMKQRLPKSILKKSCLVEQAFPEDSDITNHVKKLAISEAPMIKTVCEEVIERTSNGSAVLTSERPVSRFKAARTASKR